jgi:beta-phosphoglucomutase
MPLSGGIFDVDGVLLDTPHEQAWRETLDHLLAGPWRAIAPQTTYTPGALTSAVYQTYVAGKPREAGAHAALAYFHVPDPTGQRRHQYAEAKQRRLEALAQPGQFHAFDDALRFLLAVKAAGVRIATASSSTNATLFLRMIPLGDFCARHAVHYPFLTATSTLVDIVDVDVSGQTFPRGKPDPAIFLAAAAQLGYRPSQCFVVEDAPAGIQAAKAGHMVGLGVARHADAAGLWEAGADLVVTSLDEVAVDPWLQGALVRRGDRRGATP